MIIATGEMLKRAREDAGWTQAQLAEKLDVNRTTVALFEKKAQLRVRYIKDLDKIFGGDGWRRDRKDRRGSDPALVNIVRRLENLEETVEGMRRTQEANELMRGSKITARAIRDLTN